MTPRAAPRDVHYELLLPGPLPSDAPLPSKRTPFEFASSDPVWLEVVWGPRGPVRYLWGSTGPEAAQAAFSALREAFPGVELGPRVATCPFEETRLLVRANLFRGIPSGGPHFLPMQLSESVDRGGMLLRSLSPVIADGRGTAILQFLFRRVPSWEHRPFGTTYGTFVEQADRSLRTVLLRRQGESVYHLEARLALSGDDAPWIASHLNEWLTSWSRWNGGGWRRFRPVPSDRLGARIVEGFARPIRSYWNLPSPRLRYYRGILAHNPRKFASRRDCRDVAGRELAAVLPIPWRERHPGLVYAGAPAGSPDADLVVPRGVDPPRRFPQLALPPGLSIGPPVSSPGPAVGFLGTVRGTPVRLPAGWHHLVILGRTRSGKSTTAQNVVLDLLRSDATARVIVLEPTGGLIHDLVERLPAEVAKDTLAIDPSRPTFTRDGVEMAAVPLNLLQMPSQDGATAPERERQAEHLSGDLVQAIKNAWGEESIGGRADFILRAVLQGLSGLEGATLVDAYAALSDKAAMKRLERLATGDSLRSTLKVHLPKLDYSMTISSLDKVGKIATNPLFRKALCQRAEPVPFEQLLQHRLLLLNLGKGPLGTEGAGFLGAIFLTRLWSAIQERSDSKTPIYLVVDEFHNYAIPAFADMLSEGARLGLHVVPITQFLGRIPPKVRSAMVGNVDAWMMFSLGAEDTREAWQIARGEQFGWRPEDLDGGLRPHQAALATRGNVIKVDARAPVGISPKATELVGMVEESSRRYARPEDSGASPLTLSQDQVVRFLGALDTDHPRQRAEVGGSIRWSPDLVSAAVSLCQSEGDAAEDPGKGIRLLRRGRYLREAVGASRNEGEEHNGLLADAAAFLDRLAVPVRILPQGGVEPRADAEFETRGCGYNIEVECSTLTKHFDQVVRNVRKALEARRRVLIVVSSQEAAAAFLEGVESGARDTGGFWEDIGLIWRAGPGVMVPYDNGSAVGWGWLTGREEPALDVTSARVEVPALAGPPSAVSDAESVRVLANRLLATGRDEATALDFARVAGADDPIAKDPLRLGRALTALGLPSHRVRMVNGQTRVYDLRPLLRPPKPDDRDLPPDPT